MKLLHLSSEYPPQQVFGLGRYVQEIAEIQAKYGHTTHVITNSHGGTHAESQVGSLNVTRVHFPPPPKAPAVSAMLLHFNLQLIERCLEIRSDWDVINAHDWLTFSAAFHIARLLKRPLVTTLHDIVFNKVRNRAFDDEDAYVAGIENWACHVSAKVIVLSEVVREEVLRSYHADPARIKVIPGATGIKPLERNELEILRAWRGQFAKDDENLLLYAGRLDPEKGIFTLLEALRELRGVDLPTWKVVLAGQGLLKKKIEEFIVEHQLGSLVKLAGYLDHSTLRLAYAAADVVVVPSDYEPFGLVALEAQKMGTSVVVSNTGGLAETLSITKGGVSFFPGQSKELASKIHELLIKPTMRVGFGKLGMQNTAEAYGWSNVARNLDSVYEEVKALPPPANLTPPTWTHPRDSSPPTEIISENKIQSLNRIAIFWDTNQFAELQPLLEQLLGSHALNALDGTIHVIPVLLTGEDRPWTPPLQHPKIIIERLDGTPEAYEKILLSTAGVIAPAHLKPALLRSGLLDPQTVPVIWLDGKNLLDVEGFHAGDPQTLHISSSKVLCDERFRRALAPKAIQQIPQVKWDVPARERPLILHILPQLVTGGAEAVLLEIIKGSKDLFDHKILSIGPLEGPLPAEFEATGVFIHKLDGATPECILSCISSEAPNLLHLHSMSYIPAWIRIHRQLADAPIIETEHVVNIGSGHFGPANRILCVSNATLKAHDAYQAVLQISGCQYEVVYNGLDLQAYEKLPTKTVAKTRLGLPLDRPIIGRVSALARNKLPMESLESIAVLIEKLPEALFVIVGDGPQRKPAEEWVKKNGLEGHVRFLGERRDIPQVLCAFDVFAYYTTKDALPNVVLEAVAAGVPVVTTDVEGTSEALGDAPGTLVTLDDFEVFANTVVAWAKKPSGKRSKRHLNRLSREHMTTRYKRIYEEIISTSSIASEPVKTDVQVHREDQEPVTILLPVFNTRKDWLDQALESVARQTYDNWKLIILDDGSKREVATYLDALVQDKPNLRHRTRVMHLPENRGLPTALNIGIEASESRYLARMDSDDVIIPERIALQMAYLKQNPAIDVLGTNANLMDLEGRLFPYPTPHYNYPQKHPQILEALQRFSSIAHATTVYRRESILSAGGYDPKCLHYEDYDLWVRMAEKGFCFENIPVVTYLIRIHPDSVCQTQKEKQSIGSQKCMDRARKLLEKRLKTSSRN